MKSVEHSRTLVIGSRMTSSIFGKMISSTSGRMTSSTSGKMTSSTSGVKTYLKLSLASPYYQRRLNKR